MDVVEEEKVSDEAQVCQKTIAFSTKGPGVGAVGLAAEFRKDTIIGGYDRAIWLARQWVL